VPKASVKKDPAHTSRIGGGTVKPPVPTAQLTLAQRSSHSNSRGHLHTRVAAQGSQAHSRVSTPGHGGANAPAPGTPEPKAKQPPRSSGSRPEQPKPSAAPDNSAAEGSKANVDPPKVEAHATSSSRIPKPRHALGTEATKLAAEPASAIGRPKPVSDAPIIAYAEGLAKVAATAAATEGAFVRKVVEPAPAKDKEPAAQVGQSDALWNPAGFAVEPPSEDRKAAEEQPLAAKPSAEVPLSLASHADAAAGIQTADATSPTGPPTQEVSPPVAPAVPSTLAPPVTQPLVDLAAQPSGEAAAAVSNVEAEETPAPTLSMPEPPQSETMRGPKPEEEASQPPASLLPKPSPPRAPQAETTRAPKPEEEAAQPAASLLPKPSPPRAPQAEATRAPKPEAPEDAAPPASLPATAPPQIETTRAPKPEVAEAAAPPQRPRAAEKTVETPDATLQAVKKKQPPIGPRAKKPLKKVTDSPKPLEVQPPAEHAAEMQAAADAMRERKGSKQSGLLGSKAARSIRSAKQYDTVGGTPAASAKEVGEKQKVLKETQDLKQRKAPPTRVSKLTSVLDAIASAEQRLLAEIQPSRNTPTAAMSREATSVLQALKPKLQGPRICILGGTTFNEPESEEICRSLAMKLKLRIKDCESEVSVITGGNAGVQQAFTEAWEGGEGSEKVQLYHLLPRGQRSGFSVGADLEAGSSSDVRREVMGGVGDFYITIEGGPGVAAEARLAVARNAVVVPFKRTGGASCGLFSFPEEGLRRPACVSFEQWRHICDEDEEVDVSTTTLVDVLEGWLRAQGAALPKKVAARRCCGCFAGVAAGASRRSAKDGGA